MFRRIKDEIRILAWDDGPFEFSQKRDILIGVIFRGGIFMDGLLKTEILIDGLDAGKKIISATQKTKHKDIRVIMLDGITFAGFNIVDIKEIYKKTGLPVIVINRKKPNLKKFKSAMKGMKNMKYRLNAVESAGPFYFTRIKRKRHGGRICFQCCGLSRQEAEEIIKVTVTRSLIPEPLRIAHLIATGIVLGESVGRA